MSSVAAFPPPRILNRYDAFSGEHFASFAAFAAARDIRSNAFLFLAENSRGLLLLLLLFGKAYNYLLLESLLLGLTHGNTQIPRTPRIPMLCIFMETTISISSPGYGRARLSSVRGLTRATLNPYLFCRAR